MSDATLRADERASAAGDREREEAVRVGRCRAGYCCAHAPMGRECIDIPDLPTLWYEDENGRRWIPPDDYNGNPGPPTGFIYQHSRFPRTLSDTLLRIVQVDEVAAFDDGCS